MSRKNIIDKFKESIKSNIMIFKAKNNIKLSLLGFVVIFAFLPFNFARANTFSDFYNGTKSLINFININIIGKIRNDFCNNYLLSISTGEWKVGELRTNIGKNVCAGYKFSATNQNIGQTSVQNINDISNLSKQNQLNTQTQNNYLPEPLLGETTVTGNKLSASEIIYWTNIERSKNSLNFLSDNSILAEIASSRVEDMFNKGYFAHVSPSGDNVSKTASRNNYKYITIGENIALGNFGGSRDLVNAWMNSPGHRANILNKNYTQIGVAAAEGIYKGEKVWIAAQIFGKPLSDCISPNATTKDKISKDKISATSLDSSIKSIQEELQTINSSDIEVYNAKVSEYNILAKNYNNLVAEIKILTASYNREVQTFNECIKTI